MTDTTDQAVEPAVSDENLNPTAGEADANPKPEADGAESSPAADESGERDSEKRVPWFQKRIDEVTRDKYEERRAREAAERRLAELEATINSREEPEPETAADPNAEPLKTLADFNWDEAAYAKHVQERIDAIADRRAREVTQRILKEEREREQREKVMADDRARREAFRKEAPDFDDVVRAAVITKPMSEILFRNEMGPAMAYHLGKNPDLSATIARLPPEVQAFELGQIAAEIKSKRAAAKAAAPVPSITQAPPPTPRLDASDAAPPVRTTDPSGDKLSDDEWVRLERKRLSRKR